MRKTDVSSGGNGHGHNGGNMKHKWCEKFRGTNLGAWRIRERKRRKSKEEN